MQFLFGDVNYICFYREFIKRVFSHTMKCRVFSFLVSGRALYRLKAGLLNNLCLPLFPKWKIFWLVLPNLSIYYEVVLFHLSLKIQHNSTNTITCYCRLLIWILYFFKNAPGSKTVTRVTVSRFCGSISYSKFFFFAQLVISRTKLLL